MNLLQVTPTNVYPPSDGGQHRSHGLVSAFHDDGDAVYRYCQGGHLENYASGDLKRTVRIAENYAEFQHLNPVFDLARSPELFDLPNVFLGHSLRVVRPSRVLERIDWADVVLVGLPWQVPAVADFAGDTPVVYSSHNVELERYESTTDSALGRAFTGRVAAVERRALERADLVVCTSSRDAAEFRRRYDVDFEGYVAPNGVSAATIDDAGDADGSSVRDRHDIEADIVALFVGTDYGPNREAARAVLDMAAEVSGRGLDAHFLVVGSVGDSLSDGRENVTTPGFVSDLDPHYAAADVALNPIQSGSGTNIKAIEYLAHGLPVVTTEFGARGLDISHRHEALVTDTEDFVDAVTRLAEDQQLKTRLARRGLRFIRRNHCWEQISADLRSRLVKLVGD